MANKNFGFTLNTNGACFLCYKHPEQNMPSSSTSLTTICHLLEVNLAGMFSQPDKSLDVKVILCQGCSSMHNEFSQLYRELEMIRMKMDSCLEGINGKLVRRPGQRSASKVGLEYENDSDDEDEQKQTNHHPGMAEVLRKEIKLKCRSYMETSQSQITLHNLVMAGEPSLEIGPTFLAPVIKQEEELISADDLGDHEPQSYYEMLTVKPDNSIFQPDASATTTLKKDRSRSSALEGTHQNQQQSKSSSRIVSSSGPQRHYLCKFCSDVFDSKKDKRRHLDRHHYRQPTNCQYCNKLFSDKRSKKMHLRNGCCPVLKGKKSPPSMGGIQQTPTSTFISGDIKSKETKVSPKSSSFPCKFCWNAFSTKNGLGVHVAKKHSKTSKIYRFICPICQKSFGTMGSLKQHQRVIHHLLGQFSCKSCLESFDSEYGLHKHEKLMCKSNPNVQASQETSHSSTSASSSSIFVLAEPLATFSSPLAASSSSRGKLALNIRNHFPCPLCGRIFTAETDLFEHQRLECEVLVGQSGIPDQSQHIKEEEPEQSANIFLDPLA